MGMMQTTEQLETRVISCERCPWVALRRRADVMECAREAVQHLGGRCDPSAVVISPLGWAAR
jgi:hypothetical protein